MKPSTNKAASKVFPVVLCGVLSVLIDFILIPQGLVNLPQFLRSFLLPDPIWMSLMILIPVLIGSRILTGKTHIPAGYVWIGLPVQYLILLLFAEPISRIGGRGEWTYIWDTAIWPLVVTVSQFISLLALRARKRKNVK